MAEGARFQLRSLRLKNRGVQDVLSVVCNTLKGLPEATTITWERTVVQQCIEHLIGNSFHYAGRHHRDCDLCRLTLRSGPLLPRALAFATKR